MSHLIARGLAGAAFGGAVLHLAVTVSASRDWHSGPPPAALGWAGVALTGGAALMFVVGWLTGAWSAPGTRLVAVPATLVALAVPFVALGFATRPTSDSSRELFNGAAWALIAAVGVAGLVLLVRAPWPGPSRLVLLPAVGVVPVGVLTTLVDESAGWWALQVTATLAVLLPAALTLSARAVLPVQAR
ncbi:hypothetical protein [Pimelobacter simplex]|uniref:hypothetical protein n=1 Tax=Nocardioides simplex TaxID=2045 RepID=UPI00214F85D2|nr:hypothetical protein [Pimelobacter simplex]UUW89465.1 hypothetical protein M0M43_27610 [Pimelobacter simplex]UUW93294.1 hypothetical protein M0M48_16265 [Pimelobacter simplex]